MSSSRTSGGRTRPRWRAAPDTCDVALRGRGCPPGGPEDAGAPLDPGGDPAADSLLPLAGRHTRERTVHHRMARRLTRSPERGGWLRRYLLAQPPRPKLARPLVHATSG